MDPVYMPYAIAAYVVVALVGVILGSIAILHVYCRLTVGICDCTTDMTGKTVIISGANTGIGKITATELARRGARVILACRNKDKGQRALDDIVRDTGSNNVVLKSLDLCSFASVRAFAEDILKTEDTLHILINNAGMYGEIQYELTEDGCEKTMQANHLGHFLLTLLLLGLLKRSAPSRIINVSSEAHRFARLSLDDINDQNRRSPTRIRYGNSKVANILFTRELSKRLAGTGVTAYSLHPGAVRTEFVRPDASPALRIFSKIVLFVCGKSAVEGAQTTIHLAISPNVEKVSGRYFADCKTKDESRWARSDEHATKLWEVSERLVGFANTHTT